jgi:hypothetical protein
MACGGTDRFGPSYAAVAAIHAVRTTGEGRPSSIRLADTRARAIDVVTRHAGFLSFLTLSVAVGLR